MKQANSLPKSVQAALWSYSLADIDLNIHKRIIISNILNFGTKEATSWLFKQYGQANIAAEAEQIPSGQWDKRSLGYWSLILGIHPENKQVKIAGQQ